MNDSSAKYDLTAILAILCGVLSFCGSIYAGFSNGGIGSAILIALVAAPASYISTFLTKFFINKVFLELWKKADSIEDFMDKFLTKFIMILVLPAHMIIMAVIPVGVYISPQYKDQIWMWLPISIILCPLCSSILSVMMYFMMRIAKSMSRFAVGFIRPKGRGPLPPFF